MVAPVAAAAAGSIWPSVISAGGSLLGGLFGSSSSKKAQKKAAAQAQAQFDAQMDETIQRRVKDATKAGLHPLFALGASPGASPTAHISGQSDAGTHLAEGIANAAGIAGRAMERAQMRVLSTQADKNFAEANLANSKAAREQQAAIAAPHTIQSGIGPLTFGPGQNIEDAESYIGEAADALGIWNLGTALQQRSRQRTNYRTKVREHKHGGKVPRRSGDKTGRGSAYRQIKSWLFGARK